MFHDRFSTLVVVEMVVAKACEGEPGIKYEGQWLTNPHLEYYPIWWFMQYFGLCL